MGSFESALARSWKTTAKSFGSALKTREFLQKDAVLHFFQLAEREAFDSFSWSFKMRYSVRDIPSRPFARHR